ncbi:glycosyltransferase [Desulfobulbus sp.]|uniref:glycosyltransferase n=1 Tax=Desulfobulbus sp. TaxID=895 RepID=UPI0027BAB620|nr:glycosyltransferase [Desulfobulbus sp.]
MNLMRIKLKIENHILTNQRYLALLTSFIVNFVGIIPIIFFKIKIYDSYLRFNFNAKKAPVILKRVVELSKKSVRASIENETEQTLIRSIVLKKYISEKEKGIVLVSFENQLEKLANLSKLNDFEKEYQVIFLPSWQPFYSTAFYTFLSRVKEPFWIMPSSARDMKLCETVGPLCLPLPFQASSWVDGDKYTDSQGNKDIDIIMLANFSKYKRHWLLFEALAELSENLKVVIAGRPLGDRNRESLILEAKNFGVADRICIIENPSNEEIRDLLGRSKMFCALSHKEGSYIAVVESMFAGAPVIMYENAIIGSKDFVNLKTGLLVGEKEKLSGKIRYLLENYGKFDTQKWAKSNISARINSKKLNLLLRENSLLVGNQWTHDVTPFYCENFNFYFYDKTHHDEDECQSIKRRFNIDIKIN